MKDYRYILLDWDGNLAKTLDVWLHAIKTPLEKRGIYWTDIEIARRCFGHFRSTFEEAGIKDVDELINEIDDLAITLLPDVELYPDALSVLESLKEAGKHTALVTTSSHKNVVGALEKYAIKDFFDTIVAYDDVTNHKPHPEPLELALKRLGGTKEQAIMIGDSDKDIGASVNAGIDSILFYPPEHAKFYDFDELQGFGPTYTVDEFRKVSDIVGA